MTRSHDTPSTLYDGDPRVYDYQDFSQIAPWNLRTVGLLVPLLFFVAAIYQTLWYTGHNDLSAPQFCWNCLAYLTPSFVLDLFEDDSKAARSGHRIRTIAEKSEAMRRLLGIDNHINVLNGVSQAGKRRMSALPGFDKVAEVGRRKLSILPGLNIIGGPDDRPPGLGNWDNSCYQNSVLQGLASLTHLPSYLDHSDFDTPKTSASLSSSPKMAEALRDLINRLNDQTNNGRRIWTPATLKSMSSWQQQDAQEYYSKVLDEVDKEISKVVAARKAPSGLDFDQGLATNIAFNLRKKEESKILSGRNPLEGLIAQRVGCTQCGYSEGLSMIPFNCLTLPLGRAWSYDISECLDEYTKLEPIEGVECGKCTLLKAQRLLNTILERDKDASTTAQIRTSTLARLEVVNEALEDEDYEEKTLLGKCKIPLSNRVATTKSRQAVIARPPKSLVAHINRSLFDELTGDLKKNYADVRFPRTLDLSPWCLGSSREATDDQVERWRLNPEKSMIASSSGRTVTKGPIYELRAVVTHYGRHENGHYICYRRRPVPVKDSDKGSGEYKEQWWRLSDDDVSMVSESNVLGQGGVFMLFYDCIEPASKITSSTSSECPKAVISTMLDSSCVRSVDGISTTETPMDATLLTDTTTEVKSEMAIAMEIPLPPYPDDDLELLDESASHTSSSSCEDTIATNTSGFDDDDLQKPSNHESTKLIVPGCMQAPEALRADEGIRSTENSLRPTSNMVMV